MDRAVSQHELFDPHHVPTVVIKVGTSSLIRPEQNSLNLSSLAGIVGLVRDLKSEGYRAILVSSGAVGVGCQRLELTTRPSELAKKQALAAVGQVHLMRYYDDLFSAYGLTCSQVLITLENLSSRSTYYNAQNTFTELLNYDVVPIVNENDTVAVEQLRIGDNDTLSAQVATLVNADWLFLLTDVDALYTANPNVDPNAKPIHSVPDLWGLEVETSTSGTQWGTGGMATKLTAARMATAGGCNVAICHFADPYNVMQILKGEEVGTVFHASSAPIHGRKRWILSMKPIGSLWLDNGAVRAVRDRHCSLFAAGISRVEGTFKEQDVVSICDEEGREFARGLVNYDSSDVEVVKGMSSKTFLKELGETFGQDEIVHRSVLCLLTRSKIQDGENEEDDEDDKDDESIVDPLADSRSTTPALPPHVSYVPVSQVDELNFQEISERTKVVKSGQNVSKEVEWKVELKSIVEEDSSQEDKKPESSVLQGIENLNLQKE